MAPGVAGSLLAAEHTFPLDTHAAADTQQTGFLSLEDVGLDAGKVRKVLSPEYALYQWAHDKVVGPKNPTAAQGRLVEYVNASSPDFKQQDAAWWAALKQWLAQKGDVADRVVWQQKECVDASGKPGADADECFRQDVDKYPAVRFFPAGSRVGQDFQGQLTSSQLVDFAKRWNQLDLDERAAPQGTPSHDSGVQMVDYYAASCPHCKTFKPTFDEAARQWDKTAETNAPAVEWKAKECFDEDWKPGKDYAECALQDVHSFPTVRFQRPDVSGIGKVNVFDFEGPRTPEALVNFVKETTADMHKAPEAGAETAAAVSTADKAAAELNHDTNVAEEGYDYKLVNYYSAAGPRSQRMQGIFDRAQDKWQKLTDPDEDAMFVAGLKKKDEARGVQNWGSKERTDPPFVWFEQRECYDKDWHPGHDYALCKKHGVGEVPSMKLFSADGKAVGFPETGVEFNGPRTVKGVVDFLRKETHYEDIAQRSDNQFKALVGAQQAAKAHAAAVPQAQQPGMLELLRQKTHVDDMAASVKQGVASIVTAATAPGAKAAAAAAAAAGDAQAAEEVAKELGALGMGPPSAVLASLPEKVAAMPLGLLVMPPPPMRSCAAKRSPQTSAGFL